MLLSLIPGARLDPLVLTDFVLAIVATVIAHDVRPRAWQWLFRVVAGALVAAGFLTGIGK